METSYTFLRRDGASLNADCRYDLSGAWQDMPGDGVYVGLDVTWVGGCRTCLVGELLVEMECEKPTGAVQWILGFDPFDAPIGVGMPKYRRVRARRVVAPDDSVMIGELVIRALGDGAFRVSDTGA